MAPKQFLSWKYGQVNVCSQTLTIHRIRQEYDYKLLLWGLFR